MKRSKNCLLLLIAFALPGLCFAAKDEKTWNQVLKPQFFAGKTIKKGNDIIQLTLKIREGDSKPTPD
ncbi:hypothetical protein [Bathymodiolus japonicus methanotrophic gill symbiont]|uniref:hypothetical protein n=1 Tax=Bathymodiolus japonicus methanotrophic gill symbiont TaxID=113269 RepID=UPI0030841126